MHRIVPSVTAPITAGSGRPELTSPKLGADHNG
jgi:hypothetical protein